MSEAKLQMACVEWFDYQFKRHKDMLFAIPNGEIRDKKTVYRKGVAHTFSPTGNKLKLMGVRKGIPDLMLAVPMRGYHGMFIEMKFGKGTTSPEQKEKIQQLTNNGYFCTVCNDVLVFKNLICNYLGQDR